MPATPDATPRQRAIDALSASGDLPPAWAECCLRDLEAAGLRIVDAAEHDRDQRLLRESIDALAAPRVIEPLDGSGL